MGELMPTLAAKSVHWQTHALQGLQRQRMDGSPGVAPCRRGAPRLAAEGIHQDLRHDAPRGVTRAEKEDCQTRSGMVNS
jgi:hypothetical protein